MIGRGVYVLGWCVFVCGVCLCVVCVFVCGGGGCMCVVCVWGGGGGFMCEHVPSCQPFPACCTCPYLTFACVLPSLCPQVSLVLKVPRETSMRSLERCELMALPKVRACEHALAAQAHAHAQAQAQALCA